MNLPTFVYHPDPLGTGSIVQSDDVCQVCERMRGYTYTAVAIADVDLDVVCPWCIADGSAHARFSAEFTSPEGIGRGYEQQWDAVSREVIEEVAYRTPGFSGWQEERWFTHCGDAAAFIGPVGKDDLLAYGPDVVEAIKRDSGLDGEEWEYYLDGLDRDYGASAYLFRCLHCGLIGGYTDCL